MQQDAAHPRVLAVIVVYRQTVAECAAFRSLSDLLLAFPENLGRFACLLYDNSPVPGPAPDVPFTCSYLHDPSNPGLALPYQRALDRARATETPWLLLLDQDTTLTLAWFRELLSHLDQDQQLLQEGVVALAPKLLQDGDVLSPHWPSFHRNRGSFLPLSGVLKNEVAIFNSGSVLRTDALFDIGGFPAEFPLDYLDHAVYRQLQRRGGRLLLLDAVLQHHLASKNKSFAAEFRTNERMHSIIRAQSRFYRRYGNPLERTFHLLRRVQMALALLTSGEGLQAWKLLRYTVSDS